MSEREGRRAERARDFFFFKAQREGRTEKICPGGLRERIWMRERARDGSNTNI